MKAADALGFGKITDSSRGLAAMKTRSYPYFRQRLVAFATVDHPVTNNSTSVCRISLNRSPT